MLKVKSVFIWLHEKTKQQLSCILISIFIWGLGCALLSLWESFKMCTFRCLQTMVMTSCWMFYCPFFEVCKYWVRPWLYPAVPDFSLKLLFVGQDCLKIAVLSVKFYCFLRQNLFAFEFFNFSNTFSTHIQRKVEIRFEAQDFDGFLEKDSLSFETISNGHIDLLSRLRLWNHNESAIRIS